MANLTISSSTTETKLSQISTSLFAYASNSMLVLDGKLILQSGATFTIDKDCQFKNIILQGGTTEATRTTLFLSDGELGQNILLTGTNNWSQDGASVATRRYSSLIGTNSSVKTQGDNCIIGGYNPTVSQANVTMEFHNVKFFNLANNYTRLGAGQYKIAPNSYMTDTSFVGMTAVWYNGPPDPRSSGTVVRCANGLSPLLGSAVAGVGDITLQQSDTDWVGCQQMPSSLTLYSMRVTEGLRTNQDVAGRFFQFGKLMQPALPDVTEPYRVYITKQDGSVFYNEEVDPTAETPVIQVPCIRFDNTRVKGTITVDNMKEFQNSSRFTVQRDIPLTILIRQAGIIEQRTTFDFDDLQITEPEAMSIRQLGVPATPDFAYQNTSADITVIDNADQLYDRVEQLKVAHPFLDEDIFTATGTMRTIKSGYRLIREQNQSVPVTIVVDGKDTSTGLALSPFGAGDNAILVKTGGNGMQSTSTADTLGGYVDPSFDGFTTLNYALSSGFVDISMGVEFDMNPTEAVFGIWLASQDMSDRTGIKTAETTETIEATPGTEYWVVVDAPNFFRSTPVRFTAGQYGSTLKTSLVQIVNGQNPFILTALSTAQQRIADTILLYPGQNKVEISLPADYDTDVRYDTSTSLPSYDYTQDDFKAIAHKIQKVQSSQEFLQNTDLFTIRPYVFSLGLSSAITISQKSSNPTCVVNMTLFETKQDGDDGKKSPFARYDNGFIQFNPGVPTILDVVVAGIPQTQFDEYKEEISQRVDASNLGSLVDNRVNGDGDTEYLFSAQALENTPAGGGGEGTVSTADTKRIADALLDTPQGQRTDGSPCEFNSFGYHNSMHRPQETVRQMLQATVDGVLPVTAYSIDLTERSREATRHNRDEQIAQQSDENYVPNFVPSIPMPETTYGEGSIGDSLQKSLTTSSKGEVQAIENLILHNNA